MDVVAALGMVVLAAWLVVMAAFTAVCAVAGICLIFGWNIAVLLPSMHRLCAVLAGLMLLALCGLSAVGTVYYAASSVSFAAPMAVSGAMRWPQPGTGRGCLLCPCIPS